MYDNPQITKARSEIFKLGIKEFFELSMLVGISEAIRLLSIFTIFIKDFFIKYFFIKYLFILFKNSLFLYTSSLKDIADKMNRSVKANDKKTYGKDERFYEWLAGVIDGDGCFLLSKKGYASLEITTQLRDKKMLYLIKQVFGGSVKLYSGDNYLRYRLHHKKGLVDLIDKINGLLQNPTRILQLGRICIIYDIELKNAKPLSYYNG